MKKYLFLFLSLLPAMYGEALELILSEGSLHGQMSLVEGTADNRLVLKGEVTPYDLTALRALPPSVTSLDMSGLTLKEVTLSKEDWFGQKVFAADEIPSYMLLGTNVETLILPAGTKKIGDGAFSATPLKTFDMSNISWLGKAVFHNCRNLETVDFSQSYITTVPERTFSGCVALKNITLPSVMIYIGPRAFEGAGIVKANIPKALEIAEYAFANASSLEEISFSNGCRIGEGAFFGTGSLSLISGQSGETGALFSALSAGNDCIVIKSSNVGEGAYAGSKATSVKFIGSTQRIGARAFFSMPDLKSVYMEDSDTMPEADETSFEDTSVEGVVLYVKRGEGDKWKQAPVWQRFNIMEVESGIDDIAAPDSFIGIACHSDVIRITADTIISDVAVYSTDGMVLYSASPSNESVDIPFPDEADVVIVKVNAGGGVKVAKLAR